MAFLSGDTLFNGDECDCSCHRTGGQHFIACCWKCPWCQKLIRSSVKLVEHQTRCRNRDVGHIVPQPAA